MSRDSGIVGSFRHLDGLVEAIQAVRSAGYEDFEVFSPVPRHEIESAVGEPLQGKKSPAGGKSPVRFLTFFGVLAGMAFACGLTVLTSWIWDLIVGGKPILSIPPFLVPVFELAILFGGIATLLAVLFFGRLPRRRSVGYHPSFSDDCFGLYVRPGPDRIDAVRTLLESARAERCWKVPEGKEPP